MTNLTSLHYFSCVCVFPSRCVIDSCGTFIVKYVLIVSLFSYEDLLHTSVFLVVHRICSNPEMED